MTNNHTPLVSIITVCLNAEKTIRQTIESVIYQTYQNIEYIIIDGQSTDNTAYIINEYRDKIAIYVSEKDSGIYDAMNKGIIMASGEIIGIINADDWYEPNAVQIVIDKYLASDNKDNTLFYGFLRIWKENKEYCVRRFHHNFITETVIQHPTNFVPKALYQKYGVFDTSYRIAADYDFLNRLRINNVDFFPIDNIIANFRIGGASFTQTNKAVRLEYPMIQHKYGLITESEYRKIEQSIDKSSTSIIREVIKAIKRRVCK